MWGRRGWRRSMTEKPTFTHVYDWGADVLGAVDDLLDTWDTQGNVHARHPGKMEGLESHLRPGLPDGLSPKCADLEAATSKLRGSPRGPLRLRELRAPEQRIVGTS